MALSKKAVKRLSKLADFMDKLPKKANKHFDMRAYFDQGEHVKKDFANKNELMEHCGTTACAAGWATVIPSFRKAGFTAKKLMKTDYEEKHICKFFDIEEWQCQDLFGPLDYLQTPKQWAKMARKYIEEDENA